MIVDRAWNDYLRLVVPKGASETQIRETRRAFYAGALLVYEAVNAIGEPNVSKNTGVRVLETIQRECAAFIAAEIESLSALLADLRRAAGR